MFTTNNGLSHNAVLSLLQDRDGTIWIGTSGGLNRLKDGKVEIYTTSNGLSHNSVSSLLQDHTGALWIGTNGGGLNRLQHGKFQVFTTRNGLSHNVVSTLLQDCQGTLWIGTLGGGFNRLKDGKFEAFTTKNGLTHDGVTALAQDGDCRGNHNNSHIHCGALWIGTNGGGLNRLQNGKLTKFTTKNGLSRDIIRSLLADREGALWIGTHGGGLNRLKDGSFTEYSSKTGLSHDVVWSLLETRKTQSISGIGGDSTGRALWIGTNGGGLNRLQNNKFTTFTVKNGLLNDDVVSLAESRDGALWIGTGKGLHRLKNGRFTAFTIKNGLSSNSITSLLQDREGALWIGTASGGLNCLKDGKFTVFTTKDGLAGDGIGPLMEDHEGALWIGTNGGGLSRLKGGKFTTFTTNNGLSSNVIYSLLENNTHQHAKGNGLWIGTQDGLNFLKDGKCTTITTNNGLFDNIAFCILEDESGHLWMSCNKGVYRVDKRDLLKFAEGKIDKITCRVFAMAEGMKSPECSSGKPAGWKDAAGRLWFPTVAGIVGIQPNKLYYNAFAPPVVIEEVKAGTKPLTIDSAATLGADTERLEFRYTATSLLVPERVQFKYSLEGYDREWTDAGNRRAAYYTNLPRGRQYVFRVIACNNDGIWNKTGATFVFYLEQYFWETFWFYGLCVVLTLSSGLGVYRWRVQRLRQRAEVLEQKVVERTEELQESNAQLSTANAEIQRQMDLLGEQASEIEITNTQLYELNEHLHLSNAALDKANQFKTQMLSIVAHDLKNPLSVILGFSEVLGEITRPESDERRYVGHISSTAVKMLTLVQDLLETAAVELGKMEIFKQPMDLTALINETITFYQLTTAEKQQTILFDTGEEYWVVADWKRLRQVTDNIISNAIKYSPHGTIIRINLTTHNKFVRLSIMDEGPGITPEDKDKLFQYFQRLSAQPTGGESATGVGLAIAKKIVELHDGRIWCESDPGTGATFIVELPSATGYNQ